MREVQVRLGGIIRAAYWLGMAMYRKYPRRVLTTLHLLLTTPT